MKAFLLYVAKMTNYVGSTMFAGTAHIRLLEGSGNTRNIVCPYHAWSYALTGELRHARNSEKVPGFDKSEFCLQPVQVDTMCGLCLFQSRP